MYTYLFFWIFQNDFEWSRKINKYCYNKQSASGINPIGVLTFNLFSHLSHKIAMTLGYKLLSSLFSYGKNFLSSDHWNKNLKNHKHVVNFIIDWIDCNLLRNTRPKTADLSLHVHAQCWKNLSLQAFLWASSQWAFNSRREHFCMHMALATVWGSGQLTFKT